MTQRIWTIVSGSEDSGLTVPPEAAFLKFEDALAYSLCQAGAALESIDQSDKDDCWKIQQTSSTQNHLVKLMFNDTATDYWMISSVELADSFIPT